MTPPSAEPKPPSAEERARAILDPWWKTEPFGWDHPDTYGGILALLVQARADGLREAAEVADVHAAKWEAGQGKWTGQDIAQEIRERAGKP